MPPTDAILWYRWMWLCFDAGVAYARGERPLEMEPGDAAMINIVRADWRQRMRECEPHPGAPSWLAALQEAHEPAPWGD